MFASSGSANATGSISCTSSSYVMQETRYHGNICYTNPGYDDLSTSAFWTGMVWTGNNSGWIDYRLNSSTDKSVHTYEFQPLEYITFEHNDVVALVGLGIFK